MSSLTGKIALVTGAGQGVGQGIALALANAGATIAVVGRTQSKLEATVAAITARGGRAQAFTADVKDADSLQAMVAAVVAQLGGIQILVNNAQEVSLGSLLNLSDADLAKGWESGPQATFRLMKLCYPYLKGDGCIINLATSAAKRWDLSGYGAYAAVKEATRQLTRAAACEWAKDGIRSNVIMPLGDSPAMAWWTQQYPSQAASFVATVPQGRVGDCEADVGVFVANLCTDACRYINGQSIGVDGGQAFFG